MIKAIATIMLASSLLAACGGSPIPKPTSADAARGQGAFPGLTVEELSAGRGLYVSRCGSCHALKRPAELSAARWQEEVAAMRDQNGVHLSDAEARAIVRYLSVAATPG